ncbi:UNVERIFIED_CONTAM: hypothetical protein FKN15_009569 [Acipenser sinensis]
MCALLTLEDKLPAPLTAGDTLPAPPTAGDTLPAPPTAGDKRPTLGPAHMDIRPSCARTLRSAHTSQLVAPLGMPASDGPAPRTRITTGTSWLGPPAVAVAASACSPFLWS